MKRTVFSMIVVIFLPLLIITCGEDDKSTSPTQSRTLDRQLAALPGATVTEIGAQAGFSRAFEINLPQPVDHDNPSGQQFSQRIFISHRDETAPTVLLTSGYGVSINRVYYLTELLNANQVYIDHRYFDDAAPNPVTWEHMNAVQAAADCHRIVQLLSSIYTGPWVSHGVSKGGIAALYFRRYYPDDVSATVAQVAPISLDTADIRYDDFLLNQVGDAACRQRILDFQRVVLSRRASLLPLYQDYVTQNQLEFRLGLEAVFEINILEFLFLYWQFGPHDCSAIPEETATTQEIFDYLQLSGEIDWLRDESMERMAPAWYQIYTELGYYRLIEDHVSDLLETPYHLSYSLFFPQGVPLSYDPSSAQELIQWLQSDGDNILYIYGEIDPYTACGMSLTGQANALKIILPNESHMAGFNGYGPYAAEVNDSLESWLGITIGSTHSARPVDRRQLLNLIRGLDTR